MSVQTVQTIVGRAVTDSEFRNLLLNNPEEALSGYDLEAEEKEALMNMDSEKLAAFSESLDERITKGFMSIG